MLEVQDQVTDNKGILTKERIKVEKGEEAEGEPGSKRKSGTKLLTTKEDIINAAKKGNRFTNSS